MKTKSFRSGFGVKGQECAGNAADIWRLCLNHAFYKMIPLAVCTVIKLFVALFVFGLVYWLPWGNSCRAEGAAAGLWRPVQRWPEGTGPQQHQYTMYCWYLMLHTVLPL